MSAFRFVHIADVHLDAPFASRDAATRELLASSLRRSFENAVGLALEEKVDAFLIAGDLFDRPDPSLAAEAFLLRQIRRLSEASVPVFYCTGNHDPGLSARRGRRMEWPAGVTVFADGNPVRREVRGAGGSTVAWVTGAGHEGPAVSENLATRFPRVGGTVPEIALLHASLEGSANVGDHSRYAPCSTRDLGGKGYDYWALGHIHKREAPLGTPPVRYPGSLLGLNRTETGEKGVLLVEIRRGEEPGVAFQPTAPVAWRDLDLDVTGAEGVESLRQLIHTTMTIKAIEPGSLLTVHLRGASPLKEAIEGGEERAALEEELRFETGLSLLSLRTEGLRRVVDLEEARVGPVGAALGLAASLREGNEPFDAVLRGELAGCSSEDAAKRAEYLRALLEGADEELVWRMWREKP